MKRFGRIDVPVNNAGHGLLGAVEEASDAEVTGVNETNVFGLLRVTRAVFHEVFHGFETLLELTQFSGQRFKRRFFEGGVTHRLPFARHDPSDFGSSRQAPSQA